MSNKFGHRSFLLLGSESGADLVSLIKGGYEILECSFSFQQGVDQKGKATTKVHSGSIKITLSQLPKNDLIEWSLNSRKYLDGVIVLVDAENTPIEKTYFFNATCAGFDVDFTQHGKSYAFTKLVIRAEKMTVGSDIDFKNDWIYD